ncbi:SAM-dependent methyltransferase [Streptomyces sp. NPDC004609]|uniref:SAM-dependent methyltransferase n=1 Tax=Streptomyces sp. NPDC004609 TaxID=3364704 RepID=UPI003683F94D
MADTGDPPALIDTTKPHPARMYDYYLGGKDYYPVDRETAEKALAAFPAGRTLARENRAFMNRAAKLLAERGIRQFLDIGTGIPTEPNLHTVVQKVVPDARVVYVDNDPIVLAHAEALLTGTSQGSTDYIQADARDPETILGKARRTLDFDQPIALSLVALLHFIPDEHRPFELVRQLFGPMAPGSHLMLSHVTGDFDPETWERVIGIYRGNGVEAQVRSRDEFTAFFDSLDLVDPGVELGTHWHPVADPGGGDPVPLYVGVARKG